MNNITANNVTLSNYYAPNNAVENFEKEYEILKHFMKIYEDTDFRIFNVLDALEKRRTDIFKRICKGDIPENFNVPKLDLLKGLDLNRIYCEDLEISDFDLTETNFSKA